MKAAKLCSLLSALALLSGIQARAAATSIGVEFLGRDGSGASGATSGNPATPGVGPNDTTGVVPQQLWNLVDDYRGSIGAEKGETPQLIDSTITTTTVTLQFDCNDSWYNDVTPTNITKPNAHLMNGIIKVTAGGGVPGTLIFTNVPEGQYDLYVYTSMNGDNTIGKFYDMDRLTTYYVKEFHQFYDTNTFVQGTATDLATATAGPPAGYIKFSNLGTYGRGTIGVSGEWISGNDGIGIAALQLVSAGAAQANTNPVSIVTQPINRRGGEGYSNVTFSVVASGPLATYQWYENGSAINGATDAKYTPAPITAADNNGAFYCIVSNNVNSVKSSNAILTVGQFIKLNAIDESLWFGATRADVENGLYDTNTPDLHLTLLSFSTKEEQGDNYAERVSGLFVPKVTTNYTFFVTSDDDSDLFLSTDATPGNKRLIAQEIDWSNPLTWNTDDGGAAGAVNQKRSDRYSADGTTTNYAGGIALVAGTQYYIEAVHHEGGGGDEVDATFKIVGEPDPKNGTASRITSGWLGPYALGLDGAYVVITNQPANASVLQAQKATFTVGAYSGYAGDASGLAPAISYQWQSAPKGSSTFTDIAGQSGTSFTTPVLTLADNGTQYRANLLAVGVNSNSAIATLAVSADTNPPVAAVGTIIRNDGVIQVGVGFNKPINLSTLVLSNFSLVSGTVANFRVATNSYLTYGAAVLDTGGLTPGNTYQIVVQGVQDLFGNTMTPTTNSFTVGTAMGWADTGVPPTPGQVVPVGPSGFDILNGGRQEWSSYDEATIAYVKKTNDFDVKVQVVYAEPGSKWTRVGLQARNWLNAGEPSSDGSGTGTNASAYAQTHVNPTQDLADTGLWPSSDPNQPQNAGSNNGHEQNQRLTASGATSGWGSTAGVPAYPNVWLRLARSGAILHGYRSADGVTWTDQGTTTLTDQQPDMYVGPFLAVETGNIWNGGSNPFNVWSSPFDPTYDRLFLAQFRNFGDYFANVTQPVLSFTHNADGTLTLTYTGNLYSSTTVNGTYGLVPGAASPYKVTPQASGAAAATFYRAGP
jgi:hypothetical protein